MSNNKNDSIEVLKAYYRLNSILANEKIIEPSNLDTTYEYYLLENLASGLVTDDPNSSLGYSGVLAKLWKKIDPYTSHK